MGKMTVSLSVAAGLLLGVTAGYVVLQNTAEDIFKGAIAERMPAGMKLSYNGARFGLLSHSARLRHAVLTSADGVTLTADKVALFDPGSEDQGFRRFVATGVHVAGHQWQGDARRIAASGMVMQSQPDANPSPWTILAGVGFDRFMIGQAAFQAEGLRGSFGMLRVQNYGQDRTSAASLVKAEISEGIDGSKTGAGAAFMELGGMDLQGLAGAVLAHRPVPSMPGEQVASIEGGWLVMSGHQVADVAQARQTVTEFSPGTYRNVVAVAGLRMGEGSPMARTLEGLGYADVRFSLDARSEVSLQGGRVSVPEVRLSAPGLGTLRVSLSMDGVPLASAHAAAAMPQDLVAKQMAEASLVSLSLSYTDSGLFEHEFASFARNGKTTPETFRQNLLALISNGPRVTQLSAEGDVRDALAAFVASPGTLQVALAPGHPVSLVSAFQGYSADPDAELRLLGFSVQAK